MPPGIGLGEAPGCCTVQCRPYLFEAFQPNNTAIVVIASKCLVPAFSREENLYVISGQLRHVVHGNRGRLTNGLFHVPDIAWKKFSKITGANCHVVMLAAKSFGC